VFKNNIYNYTWKQFEVDIKKILEIIPENYFNSLAGVAYNTVVKIESGENPNPTIDTLRKIAKALNAGVDDLIR
jgi:transcriptional regulator with XRE-family HTH domain